MPLSSRGVPPLPNVDMPLPPRVLVKWSKWKTWRDETTGQVWVAYACRHTEDAVPERFGEVTYDPKRPFLCVSKNGDEVSTDPESTGPYDEVWTTIFITHGAMVQAERSRELFDAVRSGDIPRKPEGGPYPILPERDRAA